MVEPISKTSLTYQPSTILEKLPTQSNLQYGISSFMELSLPKKSFIALVFLGIGALFWTLWKKRSSAPVIPKDIHEWVKQNCGPMNKIHQYKTACFINKVENDLDGASEYYFDNFPQIVDEFLETCLNLTSQEGNTVRDAVHRYFKEIYKEHTPHSSFTPSTEKEILGWINRRPKGLSDQQLIMIVQKVQKHEKEPGFLRDPKNYVRGLRDSSWRWEKPDVAINRWVLAYLSFKHKYLRK